MVGLTTEVEEMSEEETDLVEALKVWNSALFQVGPQRLLAPFFRCEGFNHGAHHIELCARHANGPAAKHR